MMTWYVPENYAEYTDHWFKKQEKKAEKAEKRKENGE